MDIESLPATVPDSELASDTSALQRPNRLARIGQWVRKQKIKSILLVLLVAFLAELATIPFLRVAQLRTENPSETALMRQRMQESIEEGARLSIAHRWIPLSKLPKELINAVIVAEDGTFFTHGGIDWFEVQESFEANVDKGRVIRGASTITQQLAKNLYLSTSKDPIRKLKEVGITLLLEHYLNKQRILEIYLNVIEWGRGIFGVEAAAQTYFGKSASALTLDEAVRLAAVIPSPLWHRPGENSRYVLRRKQIVLERMAARRFILKPTSEENTSNALLETPHDPAAGPSEQETVPTDSTAIDEDDDNGL
jgi:monofunctional glycosyltransferase